MRPILVVLGLLIAMSASADAATRHHFKTRHHLSSHVTSSFNFAPGWGYQRTAPSVHYGYTPPAYSDDGPNNRGGLVGGNPNGA
jgi:hypothetical protein